MEEREERAIFKPFLSSPALSILKVGSGQTAQFGTPEYLAGIFHSDTPKRNSHILRETHGQEDLRHRETFIPAPVRAGMSLSLNL